MRVDINESKKIVLLWKSTAESDTPVPEEIQEQLDGYRSRKFRIIVMRSGKEDLFEPTLELLLRNRMKKAMDEAAEEYKASKKAV